MDLSRDIPHDVSVAIKEDCAELTVRSGESSTCYVFPIETASVIGSQLLLAVAALADSPRQNELGAGSALEFTRWLVAPLEDGNHVGLFAELRTGGALTMRFAPADAAKLERDLKRTLAKFPKSERRG